MKMENGVIERNIYMKTKIVTSYYAFHHGEPFWGQLNRDRWYKYSLATICGLGTDIVCYTEPGDKGFNQLQEIKEKFNLNNLTIKIFEMAHNPYQDRVYKIRTANSDVYNNPESIGYYTRSTQIYWMKFLFLEMEHEPDIQLYWIDSGLAHSGLFPTYSMDSFTVPEHPEYQYYAFRKAFTPQVLAHINNYAEDKIINLYRNTTDDNLIEFNTKLNLNQDYQSTYVIAGFFGGDSNLMLQYIGEVKNVIEQILETNNVCSEQEIMTYVNATHRTWFKNWKFDTFYHEDWTNIFTPDMISFSHFFLKN